MKKYDNFILESNYIKKISIEETLNMLETTHIINHDALIFRKVVNDISSKYNNTYSDINLIDPTTITRQSPNNPSNIGNILCSNLPSWEKYPKRNKSLICGSLRRADNHFSYKGGTLYLVIPEKDSTIGVVESDDFWDAFTNSRYYDLKSMTKNLYKLINKYNNITIKKLNTNWNLLKNSINKIPLDEILENYKFSNDKPNFKSSFEVVDYIFSPENNLITQKKYEDLTINDNENQEYWTDSTSLVISYDFCVANNIIKDLR